VQLLQRAEAADLVQLRGLTAGDTVITSPGIIDAGARLQVARQQASTGGQP
jgi:hypothetical protein